ncbi:phage-related protein [Desulfosporosinus metallidurans]|uniref:Phage-related protein n=1 Tax=Desulfosporosinus metallidurans TaxID=1888891 RepID=A0A1Q8QJK8_9FIRM|nr:phage-related protein [Desulfosporosinus metallidurans]
MKNKDDKIATCVSDVNNGRIILNADDEVFINEVMDFSGQATSSHDDAPDILSEFANRINDVAVTQKVRVTDRRLLGI